jgi:protein-disulfide isomerase
MLCPPKFCVYAYGEAVGVTGTPSFFLDGEKLEVQSFEELVQRMEQAVDA